MAGTTTHEVYSFRGLDVIVTDATKSDLEHIRGNLRDADLLEIGSWGLTPEEAMDDEVLKHGTLVVRVDDTPCLAFGAYPVKPGCGSVWALGTDQVMSIKSLFLRQSRRWLDHLLEDYDVLQNWVITSNALHLRWLGWLDFQISEPIKIGDHRYHFVEKT